MDELRSSEALEREIRDDARKKAERILKQVDEEIRRLREAAEAQGSAEGERLSERYTQRADQYREEILARLPLEKKRLRIQWAEAELRKALASALSAMPDEELLALALKPLADCASFFSPGAYHVECLGFDPALALARLSLVLPGFSDQLMDSAPGKRSIHVLSSEARASFRADESTVLEYLDDEQREALATALLGPVEEL